MAGDEASVMNGLLWAFSADTGADVGNNQANLKYIRNYCGRQT